MSTNKKEYKYVKVHKREKNKLVYCKCGCKRKFLLYNKKGYERDYLLGHNQRGKKFPNRKAHPQTEKWSKNHGKIMKKWWKKNRNSEVVKERNRKISEKGKGILKGRKLSPQHKEKVIKNLSAMRKKGLPYKNLPKGENHYNWQGGKSFEPYDKSFNNKFKRAIRKRDNQICMKCGIHKEKLKKALDVHHINYDKKLSIPQNCCALCPKCHMESNFNRKHWTKFFQSLLSEKYDYPYSENQEIIIGENKNGLS